MQITKINLCLSIFSWLFFAGIQVVLGHLSCLIWKRHQKTPKIQSCQKRSKSPKICKRSITSSYQKNLLNFVFFLTFLRFETFDSESSECPGWTNRLFETRLLSPNSSAQASAELLVTCCVGLWTFEWHEFLPFFFGPFTFGWYPWNNENLWETTYNFQWSKSLQSNPKPAAKPKKPAKTPEAAHVPATSLSWRQAARASSSELAPAARSPTRRSSWSLASKRSRNESEKSGIFQVWSSFWRKV